MLNSELVLQEDERNNSVVTELDKLSGVSEHSVNPSAINIENSTDVIIGPVTQFHGPVTIFQNVNGNSLSEKSSNTALNATHLNGNIGKLVKSESSSPETTHSHEKSNKSFLAQFSHLRYIGITLLIVVIISIITSCAIILSTSKSISTESSSTTSSPDPYTGTDDNGNTLQPIRPGSRISREEWHGHQPLNTTKPLRHPIPLVIISHTATSFCSTFDQCSRRVKSIQESHMNELGSPDIGYNFLIGGDSSVYVGRGWDVRNFHAANSIGISFIGNYLFDHLTDDMINSTKTLLKEGVDTGKLAQEYRLVGHNQTFVTLSPGRYVYSVIKTWPHFDRSYYRTA